VCHFKLRLTTTTYIVSYNAYAVYMRNKSLEQAQIAFKLKHRTHTHTIESTPCSMEFIED